MSQQRRYPLYQYSEQSTPIGIILFDDERQRVFVDGLGGAAEPVTSAQKLGGFLEAVETNTEIPWDDVGTPSGDDLIDFSTVPITVKADGIYAVIFQAGPDDGAHPGKSQQLRLAMTSSAPGHGGQSLYDTTPLDFAGGAGPVGSISLTWYMKAGDPIITTLYHDIGSANDWDFNLLVQRLS